jgi:hypothetical protein
MTNGSNASVYLTGPDRARWKALGLPVRTVIHAGLSDIEGSGGADPLDPVLGAARKSLRESLAGLIPDAVPPAPPLPAGVTAGSVSVYLSAPDAARWKRTGLPLRHVIIAGLDAIERRAGDPLAPVMDALRQALAQALGDAGMLTIPMPPPPAPKPAPVVVKPDPAPRRPPRAPRPVLPSASALRVPFRSSSGTA